MNAHLAIPLKEGRRTADPNNPNRYAFAGLTPVGEILKLQFGQIPWVNPRNPNAKSKMARIIKSSALENRGRFHLLNRGVTLIANEGKLEHELLSVSFGSGDKRGLVDGGTTTAALVDGIKSGFTQSPKKEEEQLLRVQVFCGQWTEEEVVDLAEALNTSIQVDSFSIANLSGDFDWIKKVLGSLKVNFKVSYFANDEGDVSIDDVVQWLGLFYMDEPTTAYSSKEKCLKVYQVELSDFKKFEGVLLDIIKLSEHVPIQSRNLYNASGAKKFGRLSIIADSSTGSACTLPVTGETTEYRPHKAWVFPLMASLRPALDTSTSPYRWRTNPFKLFDKLAPELVEKVNRSYKSLQTFNAVGKNPDLYEVLAEKVKQSL
jgi:AIPR protein